MRPALIHSFLMLLPLLPLLAGCDAFFGRRMLIEGGAASSAAAVHDAVRAYADEARIPCKDNGGGLPLECWRQPVRIWAIQEVDHLTVCYSAIGLPLESGANQRRMDRLQHLVESNAAGVRLSVQEGPCSPPPYWLNNGFDRAAR